MSSKNDTEVIIDGKIFTLSGYESPEYLQKVASYINNKIFHIIRNLTIVKLYHLLQILTIYRCCVYIALCCV